MSGANVQSKQKSILRQVRSGAPVVGPTKCWCLSIPASSNQSNTGLPFSLGNTKLQVALQFYCKVSTCIYFMIAPMPQHEPTQLMGTCLCNKLFLKRSEKGNVFP